MQGCAKKIKRKNYKKNDGYWNHFAVTGASLKDYRNSEEVYQDDILKDDSL